MLESLRIQNFQSHNDSTFEFVRGVNAIVGDSDSGKSAVIRSLLLLIENQHAGAGYASHWIRSKSKKTGEYTGIAPGKEMRVTATKAEGTCSRVRSADRNGYSLVGFDDFDAIGKSIPDEVNRFFNLNSVNIHRQHDLPFLIANSGPEVARFLNKTIRMEKIDQALSSVNGKRLASMAAIRNAEEEEEKASKAVDALAWVEKIKPFADIISDNSGIMEEKYAAQTSMERDLTEYQQLLKDFHRLDSIVKVQEILSRLKDGLALVERKMSSIVSLKEDLQLFSKGQVVLDQTGSLGEVNAYLRKVSEKQQKLGNKANRLNTLSPELEQYAKLVNGLAITQKSGDELVSVFSAAETAFTSVQAKEPRLSTLKAELEEYNRLSSQIREASASLKSLLAQMPELCPTCNAPLNGDCNES